MSYSEQFVEEAPTHAEMGPVLVAQDLQRHATVEIGLFGLVDAPHPPLPRAAGPPRWGGGASRDCDNAIAAEPTA